MLAALHGRQMKERRLQAAGGDSGSAFMMISGQKPGQADEMGPGIQELRSAADKLPSSHRLAPEFPPSLTTQRMNLLSLPAVEEDGEGPRDGMEVGSGEGEGEGKG